MKVFTSRWQYLFKKIRLQEAKDKKSNQGSFITRERMIVNVKKEVTVLKSCGVRFPSRLTRGSA